MAVQPEQVHDPAVIHQEILRIGDQSAAARFAEEESRRDLFDAAEFPHDDRAIGSAVVFGRPRSDQRVRAVGINNGSGGGPGSQLPGTEQ